MELAERCRHRHCEALGVARDLGRSSQSMDPVGMRRRRLVEDQPQTGVADGHQGHQTFAAAYLTTFPSLSINHAVLVYTHRSPGRNKDEASYWVYDPTTRKSRGSCTTR